MPYERLPLPEYDRYRHIPIRQLFFDTRKVIANYIDRCIGIDFTAEEGYSRSARIHLYYSERRQYDLEFSRKYNLNGMLLQRITLYPHRLQDHPAIYELDAIQHHNPLTASAAFEAHAASFVQGVLCTVDNESTWLTDDRPSTQITHEEASDIIYYSEPFHLSYEAPWRPMELLMMERNFIFP